MNKIDFDSVWWIGMSSDEIRYYCDVEDARKLSDAPIEDEYKHIKSIYDWRVMNTCIKCNKLRSEWVDSENCSISNKEYKLQKLLK